MRRPRPLAYGALGSRYPTSRRCEGAPFSHLQSRPQRVVYACRKPPPRAVRSPALRSTPRQPLH
jgi:hypothetical protein